MNERDVFTVVRGYLYLWRHLRYDNSCKIKNFIISRTFRIHQENANIFLNVYCPKIVDEVKGINYRLFLDLIVKCVVDYQDGKLVKREFKAGKQSLWNNSSLYCQYLNPNGTEIRFRKKHPSFHFHQYDIAVHDYNYFRRTDRYCPNKYVPN